MGWMTGLRNCEQCGIPFAPRREHARFCSARCRAAWNREHARHRTAEATALGWSITAMCDVTGRLGRVRAGDQARALAAVSEAVWWVTIVDATLVRHHPGAYDGILAGRPPAERRLIEETLAGLRFVRNQMGPHLDPADFISPAPGRPGGDEDRISEWTWKSLTEPPLGLLPPSGRAWERARYRAYQAQLAGHPVGDTFGRAAAFLTRAAASADLHHEHQHAAAR
jgi:predicted nucleic acid-binding Zn ribbon protein